MDAAFERRIVVLIGAVQFVNILDFLMVMPLGPDFAKGLGIPVSQLGLVGGSYTAAAAIAGLLGSLFLDRFDRRRALGVAMIGLVIGTALGGFATGLHTLVAARVVAGAFGGPATSLSFSIIADVVPAERRGRAMGAVMGAFSAASVFGVPAGLVMAQLGTWRSPFFVVAVVGLLVAGSAVAYLPSMTGHLDLPPLATPGPTLFRGTVLCSYLMTFVVMFAGFLILPNLSTYVQGNQGYPRAQLPILYGVAGTFSFGMLRLAGKSVDRFGSFRTGTLGTLSVMVAVYFWLIHPVGLPVLAIFIWFLLSMNTRNVSYNTLTSRVPRPEERARFQSLQSAIQHGAAALGAVLSTRMLVEDERHFLIGIDRVAWVSIGLSALLPLLLFVVERRVKREEVPGPTVPAPALIR